MGNQIMSASIGRWTVLTKKEGGLVSSDAGVGEINFIKTVSGEKGTQRRLVSGSSSRASHLEGENRPVMSKNDLKPMQCRRHCRRPLSSRV